MSGSLLLVTQAEAAFRFCGVTFFRQALNYSL